LLGFVIGDINMITGFRLVGVEGIEVASVDEAEKALLAALTRSDVAIILISQQFSDKMQTQIAKIRASQVTPLIVELPGASGSNNETKLSEIISKNIGIKT